MRTLVAVVQELARFLYEAVFDWGKTRPSEIALTERRGALTTPVTKSVDQALQLLPGIGDTAYCVRDQAPVFLRPLWAFDTVLGYLSLASQVTVLMWEGKFVRIVYKDQTGWVNNDDLTNVRSELFPDLVSGEYYQASHEVTSKLRRLSHDEFFATELFLPLQPGEFVSYRLRQEGHNLSWTKERPRVPGRWHIMLRGTLGVSIGLSPRTGSVMEGFLPDRSPLLGYVKAVDPDERIELETVGMRQEGVYESGNYKKEEWLQWRPVFIQVV